MDIQDQDFETACCKVKELAGCYARQFTESTVAGLAPHHRQVAWELRGWCLGYIAGLEMADPSSETSLTDLFDCAEYIEELISKLPVGEYRQAALDIGRGLSNCITAFGRDPFEDEN